MNLLLFNFESNENSQALGFALDWINEIAKNVDKLYVVSLRCGDYKVEKNVEIYCINQNTKNKLQTIIAIWKILTYIHSKDKNISGYFVHMAHYFVPLIYPFAKIYNQKILLWYAHKSVPITLSIAGALVNKIISISSQSMRLKINKFEAVGHGIDTSKFFFKDDFKSKIKNIVTVGRISKVKNIDMIVKSFIALQNKNLCLYIVGDVLVEEDNKYLENIKKSIPMEYENNIIFTGSISFEKLPEIYKDIDLAINISDTGSLDKTIIEPMSMGIPVVTSNDSAKEIFTHLEGNGVWLLKDKNELESVLQNLLVKDLDFDRETLRQEIVQNHSLEKLAKKIIGEFR